MGSRIDTWRVLLKHVPLQCAQTCSACAGVDKLRVCHDGFRVVRYAVFPWSEVAVVEEQAAGREIRLQCVVERPVPSVTD